jgi:hypothetical protein
MLFPFAEGTEIVVIENMPTMYSRVSCQTIVLEDTDNTYMLSSHVSNKRVQIFSREVSLLVLVPVLRRHGYLGLSECCGDRASKAWLEFCAALCWLTPRGWCLFGALTPTG